MNPLIGNDIESELSYAYLHAIASKIGAGCKAGNRHDDNHGVDALLTAWGPFTNGGYIQEVDLKIQLKATVKQPIDTGTHLSYFLNGVTRYNDLRSDALAVHRILIVMFLPSDANHWISISESELILKKCAYWVSLRGAPSSSNGTGETIYLPKTQIFNPDNLLNICSRLSRNEVLNYQLP
ncbi:MAG: DUF4365 domain-containing protein [Sphingobacteriaceae bacterium]|nr:MAG: DUF4365 domain-containing protein [Sphingobacteriaceae bacterium]